MWRVDGWAPDRSELPYLGSAASVSGEAGARPLRHSLEPSMSFEVLHHGRGVARQMHTTNRKHAGAEEGYTEAWS